MNEISSLLAQLLVILAFSRLCAAVLKRLGQPQVVGEMVAGILLGRSFLAVLWPQGFLALFPESGMSRLFYLSQIGLIFFMFTVGRDLKIADLKHRAKAAVLISYASILLPFGLGVGLAHVLYDSYAPKAFAFPSFALFMGIAMSITAFPVLARILQEKRLTATPLGAMALTCAAIDDATAWCLLAGILGIVKAGSAGSAAFALGISLLYGLAMIKGFRPLLARVLKPSEDGAVTRGQLALVFCFVLASALATELIGIHALFGAFLAGAVMPTNPAFRSRIIEKIEDLSGVVLLPVFFVYTGLRLRLGLLDGAQDWIVCGAIVGLAIAGKMAGSALAARWTGVSWRESLALGALMNTRGLVELVVLNIGLDLGILSPALFTMLVLMALVTTLMTTPLITLILGDRRKKARGVSGSHPGRS